jgi:hypothetical protein
VVTALIKHPQNPGKHFDQPVKQYIKTEASKIQETAASIDDLLESSSREVSIRNKNINPDGVNQHLQCASVGIPPGSYGVSHAADAMLKHAARR